MKTKVLWILSIGLIGLILTSSIAPVRGAYGVDVGDTFTYTINKASGDFNYKTNATTVTSSTSGYALGDDVVTVGSKLLVNVTAVTIASVTFNISSGSVSIEESTTAFSLFGLLGVMILPILVLSDDIEFEATDGISFGQWMFFLPSDTDWDDFIEDWNVSEDLFNDTSSGELKVTAGSVLENSDRDIRFWLSMVGTYINDTEEIDLTADHRVMFAYDTSSGVLLGYRISTDVTGTFEGTSTTFKLNLEVIRDQYSLPGFPGLSTSGFELFLILTSLFLLLPIYRRKR